MNGAKRRIILIILQAMYPLTKNQISDYKEVFLLFDKNEDGVLSFTELCVAIRTLGLRIDSK